MKSRFESRLKEMEAMKKSANPESNKIKKEDIFDFDLKEFIEEELNHQKVLELMKQRNFDMRLKHDIESSIISVYNKDEIEHLDKSIEYLNKEIDKIIES